MEFTDEVFMRRAIDLAFLGAGSVSPNPLVGAVLVYQNRIIGEGFHKTYGGAHAEVNAVASVRSSDRPFIRESTLYVTLEPCCIFGNTPPCTNLVLEYQIPKVVISVLDQTPAMNGKSVTMLRNAGVEVVVGVLEEEGIMLPVMHHTLANLQRPYSILKYAKTKDHFMGTIDQQFWITNGYSKRLVHKWRSEVDAILVGTQTAIIDNPQLTNRHYFGHQPLRLVLDRSLRIPSTAHLLDKKTPTVVFTKEDPPPSVTNLSYVKIDFEDIPTAIFNYLATQRKSSLLVEGGATLLETFIKADAWDEARVFIGDKWISNGIAAPTIPKTPSKTYSIGTDLLTVHYNR